MASGMLYGGIHLFAWNGSLHSEVELVLWRSAFLGLTGCGALVVLLVGIYRLQKAVEDSSRTNRFYRFLKGVLNCVVPASAICFPIIAMGLCTWSRLYLVIEGFLNLPSVPDEVYLQPQWSRYFPHIA